MYVVLVRPEFDRILKKLGRKNPPLKERILKKVDEIRENPHRFKNLRAPLQDKKRVHISGSLVLVFTVDESRRTIVLTDINHHDIIYRG